MTQSAAGAGAPLPDRFPGLDREWIETLLRRGQNSDVRGVAQACRRWIDEIGDTDDDAVAWLLLVSFYGAQAEGAVAPGLAIADRLVEIWPRCTPARPGNRSPAAAVRSPSSWTAAARSATAI